MAVRYQRVYTNIWRELRADGFTEDEIILFVHILTSPHSTLLGLFYCPRSYLLEDLPGKWDTNRLEPALQGVIHKGLILYDDARRMVLIPSHLTHNPFSSSNHITAAIKLVGQTPYTPLFADYAKILKKLPQRDLGRLIEAVEDAAGTTTGRRRDGVRTTSGRRSRGVRYAVATQKQKQYQNPETVGLGVKGMGGCRREGPPPVDNPGDKSAPPVDHAEPEPTELAVGKPTRG